MKQIQFVPPSQTESASVLISFFIQLYKIMSTKPTYIKLQHNCLIFKKKMHRFMYSINIVLSESDNMKLNTACCMLQNGKPLTFTADTDLILQDFS